MKKYEDILLLGENCELAVQYVKNCGKLDSHIFNWCFVFDKNKFIEAIKNPHIIMSGNIDIIHYWNMFKDYNSGCSFHGKHSALELLNEDWSYNECRIFKDLEDLKERNIHLIEKLENLYLKKSSKLFIMKLQSLNCDNYNEIKDFISALFKALSEKTEIFDLLIIVKNDYLQALTKDFKACDKLFIRGVNDFSPIIDAVNLEKSDNISWKNIFIEFSILNKKKNDKIYKYQQKSQITTKKKRFFHDFIKKIFSINNEYNGGKKKKYINFFFLKISIAE